MSADRLGGRELRRRIRGLLESGDLQEGLRRIEALPPRRAIPPLLALLCSADPVVKHRAAAAAGVHTARLAEQDPEAARHIVRRLLWSLNDESGGIGWGAPQALAEILARHDGLAREYAAMLVSYLRTDGNYLEHVPLQRDLLRGLARLAGTRPGLLRDRDAHRFLAPYLGSPDAALRGLAARCAGLLRAADTREALQALRQDPAEIELFEGGNPRRTPVGDLAREALEALGPPE